MTPTSVQARPTVIAEASESIVWPRPPPGTNDLGAVELTDLSRFEGEGGREALGAEVIEAWPDAVILGARLPGPNELMTKETNMMKPIPEATQKNGGDTANGSARKTQAAAPARPPVPAGAPKHFRRLKPGEVVGRGDFVADENGGFVRWEGPGGFRAGAFVKPIYRLDKRQTANKKRI